ncbi:hypothetical protein GOP47_0015705 [Adiantum capillus-veneris]|uniref:Inward rectifier potassium channel C-terminal domain-containing protein n=1 Tax=Adiantum capillus-veneris TaxID=13818 RepID=A0A9D4UKT6_ADICA|nr:hypothetical protein GOP47_0015705 [Adiantum capillus-veneris]
MCSLPMVLRRDSMRLRLVPARSIEETGLDPSLFGGFASPHGAPSPDREPWSILTLPTAESPMAKNIAFQPHTPICSKCQQKEDPSFAPSPDQLHLDANGIPHFAKDQVVRRRIIKGKGDDLYPSSSADPTSSDVEDHNLQTGVSHKSFPGPILPKIVESSSESLTALEISLNSQKGAEQMDAAVGQYSDKGAGIVSQRDSIEAVPAATDEPETPFMVEGNVFYEPFDDSSIHRTPPSSPVFLFVPQDRILEEAEGSPQPCEASPQPCEASLSSSCTIESFREISAGTPLYERKQSAGFGVDVSQKASSPSSVSSKLDARSRWKRAAHSVKFVNHLASNIRVASTDLIEDRAVDEMMQQQLTQDDAGRVGAAAFEGARTVARSRSKGRKGMEGLVVKQDRGLVTFFQDFYVACLKMPIGHFLVGVFLSPLVLGLLFTPFYLLDVDGLSFNGVVPEDAATSPMVSAKQRCLAFLNIFLYALSLSTTFGGAPVAARSPFCLLVANVNTLLAQFLFVFLSGSVFARMSQPSYPIRCSKKAIIKTDDLLPVLGLEQQEKFKVFAVRLVLTGPSPCELVDAKICLTFRIFVTLPSGSVFCSTQDLEVVRSEVSYLRYGLMVRHIIDKKSPVYGHTMESLYEGDASFSLTVMGLERTSMQPVFHLEDYFVCDHDVTWEGDYEDFIRVNKKGQRVLHHSQIDLLKPLKAAAQATQAVSRMKHLSHQKQEKEEEVKEPETSGGTETIAEVEEAISPLWQRSWFSLRKRKLLKSMSTSFTRADW